MSKLTRREREVVRLLASGQTQRQIAHALVIAPITVYTYTNNIRRKVGAVTTAEAVCRLVGVPTPQNT